MWNGVKLGIQKCCAYNREFGSGCAPVESLALPRRRHGQLCPLRVVVVRPIKVVWGFLRRTRQREPPFPREGHTVLSAAERTRERNLERPGGRQLNFEHIHLTQNKQEALCAGHKVALADSVALGAFRRPEVEGAARVVEGAERRMRR